ncbi:MAG: hypothetical protein NVSMB9_10550 [Isosphaeraceae bacterium]
MILDPENRESSPPLLCSRCGISLRLGQGQCYLVEILAVADPAPPVFTKDDLSDDPTSEIQRLLQRLAQMTEQQIADQVYQRKLLCLCNGCYFRWIENPVGS